jgi:PTS system mannose-specific IID component
VPAGRPVPWTPKKPDMTKANLLNIFLRSLCIQGSLNFWRMQNVGYAFAMMPLVRKLAADKKDIADMMGRHLQMFNTHPYLSGPIIGSAVRIEEDKRIDSAAAAEAGKDADALKYALMAPYAGIGDSFFWGSLKPLSSVIAVVLAVGGCLAAPLVFLIFYNPFHFWIRGRGFQEGYRKGREGIELIRRLDLPLAGKRLRWASVAFLALLANLAAAGPGSVPGCPDLLLKVGILAAVIVIYLTIKKRISALAVLYGIFGILLLISYQAG